MHVLIWHYGLISPVAGNGFNAAIINAVHFQIIEPKKIISDVCTHIGEA